MAAEAEAVLAVTTAEADAEALALMEAAVKAAMEVNLVVEAAEDGAYLLPHVDGRLAHLDDDMMKTVIINKGGPN